MYEYLKEKAKQFSILYVEDNAGLREKVTKFLHKFFTTIYVAADGQEGLEFYLKYRTNIVVTDVKMPRLDGLSMIKKIKKINPHVKTIITSAFDDKEFLLKAIEAGVFRYVQKPFTIPEITDIFTTCFVELDNEEKQNTFNEHITDIFNYQDNLLALVEGANPIIANYNFLEFFDLENIEEFVPKKVSFGSLFLEHDKFLSGRKAVDTIRENPDSLYNIKMKHFNKFYHYILKVKEIPNKLNQYIYSFSDITELGLLEEFEKESFSDTTKIKPLLASIKNNNAVIKVHNIYKGLSIVNNARVLFVDENIIKLKVTYMQAKAMLHEKSCVLVSDFLPENLLCEKLINVDFETMEAIYSNFKLIKNSFTQREYIRVIPESNHKSTIKVGDQRFGSIMEDISIKAVRIKLIALPAGCKVGDKIRVDIALPMKEKPLIFNNVATVFRVTTLEKSFDIVLQFVELPKNTQKILVEYISKRQMAIIREFKTLNKEK